MRAVRPFMEQEVGGLIATAASTAGGAQERLASMFEVNYRFIWRSLRRLGVPFAQVDDAAQEVFVVATRRIADIEEGRERSFLFAAALRIAKDVHRSASRRRESGDEAAVGAAIDPAPLTDELAERMRAREKLDRALDLLPLELRAVFVLFEIEELTLTEIADVLAIPRGTAASRLRRSREAFSRATREVGR
jgi:RNA polymerase sigma-70 factor (ECF subfamily)